MQDDWIGEFFGHLQCCDAQVRDKGAAPTRPILDRCACPLKSSRFLSDGSDRWNLWSAWLTLPRQPGEKRPVQTM